MTLNGSLSAGYCDQTIGTWDTSSITKADYFTIRISAVLPNIAHTASTVVYLDPSLLTSNWPKWFNAWTRPFEGPVPYADSNGNTVLATTTFPYNVATQDPAQIRTFPPDGSSVRSLLFAENGSMSQPAAGDVSILGAGDEIVGTDSESGPRVRPDGTSFTLSPDASLGYLFFFSQAPILEDVDGDSLLEVVAMDTEPNYQGDAGTPAGLAYVFAWRNDREIAQQPLRIERVSSPTDDIPSPRKRADFPRVFHHERTFANRLRETSRYVGGRNACWCGSRSCTDWHSIEWKNVWRTVRGSRCVS